VTRRPSHRILLNLALDGLLALLALVLAVWAVQPRHWPSGAWWMLAGPGAVLALLAAGAVLRLPQQYWRFVGLRDLLAVAGAAFGGALLFWLGGQILGGWQPANPAFPLIHAMLLGALLIGARVLALVQATRHAGEAAPDAQTVLLVGVAEGTDLFIRALERDRRAPYRVIGILSLRARQAGRRMQGHLILGTVEEADAVLDRLRAEGRLPALIVLSPRYRRPGA